MCELRISDVILALLKEFAHLHINSRYHILPGLFFKTINMKKIFFISVVYPHHDGIMQQSSEKNINLCQQ